MVLLLFIGGGALSAQNSSEVDVILRTRELSFAQAAGFVLTAAELLPLDTPGGRVGELNALALAANSGFLPKRVSPTVAGSGDVPIKLGELCFLIMKSFNMKGNFLYSLFPGPRYSYRELKYMRLVPEPSDPAMPVSGLQLMQITEQVLYYLGTDAGTTDGIQK
ncbi:hypothetical protein LQZ19_19070 [Treponema primitia]|uniref:hypothetical protein n=1 Tax=Treponema primitia TaxID=88058 RepID=UPI00397F46D8